MATIKGEIKINEKERRELQKAITHIDSFKAEIEKCADKELTDLTKTIMVGSLVSGASDIHIEPGEENTDIRIRVDGILHKVVAIAPKLYKRLLSRIKLLSGIKLNVTQEPQDGRFSVVLPDLEIEMRVSTLPSEYGEAVVMRILNPKSLIEVKDLGIRKDILPVFEQEIKKPNGMIVTTGPTGSGKTTTLYAILKKLRSPEIKIITIEDPIEYHLGGISQSQVNPKKGYDFASGLRSIVRQDPDVILVGEIRDLETAQIALQAALTGHLVLSTIHTNNAAGTIARFRALGEKLVNIAPALNIALGQRLLRRVCKHCLAMKQPTDQELQLLKKELSVVPKNVQIPDINQTLKIPKPQGCKKCNSTGYKGRLGIYEFFVVDDEIENFILKDPSITDMKTKAQKKGMVPMRQDGFIKVVQGKTTIEEVERVTAG